MPAADLVSSVPYITVPFVSSIRLTASEWVELTSGAAAVVADTSGVDAGGEYDGAAVGAG